MKIFSIFIVYFILPRADGVVSEEYKDKTEKEEKTVFNIERRFLQDIADDQWHVSHLKDSNFKSNSECQDDTFDHKAQKYRRMLKDDGARVDFVSSDPLPFDISDIKQGVCRVGKDVGSNEKAVPTNKTHTNNLKLENKVLNVKREDNNKTVVQSVNSDGKLDTNVATTIKAKAPVLDVKVRNEDNEKSRRASEYMFSSVEYYDEFVDFDDSTCHDAVEVFTLEIDQLRNYDVECEMLLEWRSLD